MSAAFLRAIVTSLVGVALVNLAVAAFLFGPDEETEAGPRLSVRGTNAWLQDTETSDGNLIRAFFNTTPPIVVEGCPRGASDPPPPPGATLPGDPGFAFLDKDCNGAYDAAVDIAIPTAEVADGAYDAGADCLVIPPSVGPIKAPVIAFTANGGLTVLVNLTATNGGFELVSATRVVVRDVLVQGFSGNARIVSSAGSIALLEAQFFVTPGNIVVLQEAGAVGTVDLTRSEFNQTGNLQVVAAGDVLLENTVVNTPTGNIQVTTAAAIRGNDTVLNAPGGNVQMDATDGGVHLDGVLLYSAVGNFQPTVWDIFRAHDGCLKAAGNVWITTAANDAAVGAPIDIPGSTAISDGGSVQLSAPSPWVNVTGWNATAMAHVAISVDGDIHADQGRFDAQNGKITLDAARTVHTLFVDLAIFMDDNDVAKALPRNVNIVGTPAQGGISY